MKKIVAYLMVTFLLAGTVAGAAVITTTAKVEAKASQAGKLMNRYNKLLKKCKNNYKYEGSQTQMNQDAYNEYKAWDKELNYVYTRVYKNLSVRKKKELKKKELTWIRKKEKKAKADATE